MIAVLFWLIGALILLWIGIAVVAYVLAWIAIAIGSAVHFIDWLEHRAQRS